MNRTKIEWCDYTWNPVTGCRHGCSYCYARRIAHRFNRSFEPEFHEERLLQPRMVNKDSKIFVCSTADLFGEWVPRKWIEAIRLETKVCNRHIYIFLTKNPARYAEFNRWPGNCWLGTTITNQEDADQRVPELLKAQAGLLFVSAEPLIGPINLYRQSWIDRNCVQEVENPDYAGQRGIGWVIVGSMTGPGAKQPDPMDVHSLEFQCERAEIPLFEKNNLHPVIRRAGGAGLIQEFPQ